MFDIIAIVVGSIIIIGLVSFIRHADKAEKEIY